jgi:hypothetical protein
LGFPVGLIVEDKAIVEMKSVEAIAPVHKKQLLTHCQRHAGLISRKERQGAKMPYRISDSLRETNAPRPSEAEPR